MLYDTPLCRSSCAKTKAINTEDPPKCAKPLLFTSITKTGTDETPIHINRLCASTDGEAGQNCLSAALSRGCVPGRLDPRCPEVPGERCHDKSVASSMVSLGGHDNTQESCPEPMVRGECDRVPGHVSK